LSFTEICVILSGVDEFLTRELKARRRDVAGVGAVLAFLHLHGVDLHDREDPLLLDVEVERRLVAGELVLVVFQPLVQIVGPAGFDDFVVERTDHALFPGRQRSVCRLAWQKPASAFSSRIKLKNIKSLSPRPLAINGSNFDWGISRRLRIE